MIGLWNEFRIRNFLEQIYFGVYFHRIFSYILQMDDIKKFKSILEMKIKEANDMKAYLKGKRTKLY